MNVVIIPTIIEITIMIQNTVILLETRINSNTNKTKSCTKNENEELQLDSATRKMIPCFHLFRC